jgi:hypothetical protein
MGDEERLFDSHEQINERQASCWWLADVRKRLSTCISPFHPP